MDIRGRLGDTVIAVATGLAIIALVMPLFLNPIWVAFEQDRAEAAAWTGFDPGELRRVTDAILVDLVLGPPDFVVEVDGTPVLDERERSHMRDVRTVFIGFFAVTALLVIAGVLIGRRRRSAGGGARAWGAVRAGAVGLIVVLVVAGGVSLVAFDALFELFHRLFFPGGSYVFDPDRDRLVQLFPFRFWQETAIVLGAVAVVVAVAVAVAAGRRAAPSVPA